MYPPCLATKRLVRLSLSQVRVSSTFSFYHFPLSPSCACVCLSSLSIREQTPSSSIVRFGRARGCCSTSGSQLDGSEVRLSSFHLARKLSARQGRAVWDSQSEQGCSPGRRSMRNPSVPTCTGCIRALCRERNPAQPLAPPASGSGAPTFRHAVRCIHHVTLYCRSTTSCRANIFSLFRRTASSLSRSPRSFFSVDPRDRDTSVYSLARVSGSQPRLYTPFRVSRSFLFTYVIGTPMRFLACKRFQVHRGMRRKPRWILCSSFSARREVFALVRSVNFRMDEE